MSTPSALGKVRQKRSELNNSGRNNQPPKRLRDLRAGAIHRRFSGHDWGATERRTPAMLLFLFTRPDVSPANDSPTAPPDSPTSFAALLARCRPRLPGAFSSRSRHLWNHLCEVASCDQYATFPEARTRPCVLYWTYSPRSC